MVATAIVALVLVFAALGMTARVEQSIFDRIQRQAEAEVAAVTDRLAAGIAPEDALAPSSNPDLVAGSVFTHVAILDAEGNPLVGSGFFAIAGVQDVGLEGRPGGTLVVTVGCGSADTTEPDRRTGAPCSTDLAIAQQQIEVDGEDLVVAAASPLAEVARSVDAIRQLSLIGVPLLVLVVAAVTWVVTGRTLQPIEQMRHEVDDLSAQDLGRRVPVPETDDEVARLATTMNRMLGRLQSASKRQHEFVSDASHELRNPLASIRNALEVSLTHPEITDWPDIAGSILRETTRVEGIVDNLLLLARLDEDDTPGSQAIDIGLLARDEAARVTGLTVTTDIARGLHVTGRQHELGSLLRNLLDNAARHARANIALSATAQDATVVVTVEDDGPGIPVEERDRVFERFTRLDEARSRTNGGVGLGLAIVDQIARRHRGTVSIDDSPTGGARFTVALPARH